MYKRRLSPPLRARPPCSRGRPACTSSCLGSSYSDAIGLALASIGYPYQLSPEMMTVPDSLAFNTGYHLNRDGVKLVTARMIGFLNKFL